MLFWGLVVDDSSGLKLLLKINGIAVSMSSRKDFNLVRLGLLQIEWADGDEECIAISSGSTLRSCFQFDAKSKGSKAGVAVISFSARVCGSTHRFRSHVEIAKPTPEEVSRTSDRVSISKVFPECGALPSMTCQFTV